jgi:membrane-bound ClpP family serine protease
MNKRNFAFDKTNFILLAAGMIVVLIGFILMSGSGSTEHTFNPDIFSARRIKVAPMVCLAGFIFMIFAILHQPKDKIDEKTTQDQSSNNVGETVKK